MNCNYFQPHSDSYAHWQYDWTHSYPPSPDFYADQQPIKYPEIPYQNKYPEIYTYDEPYPTYEDLSPKVDNHDCMIPLLPYDILSSQTSQVSDTNVVENEHTDGASPGCLRRKMVELLHKGYFFDNTQYLLLYTYAQLRNGDNDIRWIDESKGTFFIINPDNFAKKWGAYKGKDKMDYQKVSRSFRYYYKQNLLKKVDGKLRQYRWDLKALKSLRENFKSGTPLKMENQQIRKKSPKL